MASVEFTVVENGYDPQEVQKYIGMLQSEYENAVSWGEQLEAKLDELQKSMKELGVYFTIDDTNQNEVIEKVFTELTRTVHTAKADAKQKAEDIIKAANDKSRTIVRQAMEKSVDLRTENELIMKNLKSVGDMIEAILEKEKY